MTCPAFRRTILNLAALALLAATASGTAAETAGRDLAVPFYKPEDVVTGLYRHWTQPRAAAFTDTAGKLHLALTSYCGAAANGPAAGLAEARSAWMAAAGDWERLSAVPFGPLIERRSVRAIDFTPPRPALIERAIQQAPRNAADMERVGSPAKGFPALEWLLWTKPVDRGSPACAYAVEVAADIAREADALNAAYAKADPAQWEAEKTAEAFTEFVNQWVGATERLRWQEIERPVREAKSSSRTAARFPRSASGATAAAWANHWAALRGLALAGQQLEAPQPGRGPIPIELYLRGRGQASLAERWRTTVGQADAAMREISPGKPDRLLSAAKRLAAVKRMAEEDVAPALNVTIGFSDADGD